MFLYDNFFQHMTLSFLPKNMKASKKNITRVHSSTKELKKFATCSKEELFKILKSSEKGLSQHEVHRRILKFGKNIISENKKTNPFIVIFDNIKNPLTLMLIVLASVSLYMGDLRTASVVGGMTLLSIVLSSVQELRSSKAAEKLSGMVSSTVTVIRPDREDIPEKVIHSFGIKIHEPSLQTVELPIQNIVLGDIVHLSAGATPLT